MDALLRQCLAESVAFVPGRICDPLDQMDSWIRLSYSYISEVQLEENSSSRRDFGAGEAWLVGMNNYVSNEFLLEVM